MTDDRPKDNILNLSTRRLTDEDKRLLNLGLSFIPSVDNIHVNSITTSLDRIIRLIKLRDYFANDTDEDYDYTIKTHINRDQATNQGLGGEDSDDTTLLPTERRIIPLS
jgi:hypothetical protein